MFIIQIILNAEAKDITKEDSRFIVRAIHENKELIISTFLAIHAAGQIC
ncbi:MAG: hypothetical protein ABIN04_06020 [Ginsengibacter sp.]